MRWPTRKSTSGRPARAGVAVAATGSWRYCSRRVRGRSVTQVDAPAAAPREPITVPPPSSAHASRARMPVRPPGLTPAPHDVLEELQRGRAWAASDPTPSAQVAVEQRLLDVTAPEDQRQVACAGCGARRKSSCRCGAGGRSRAAPEVEVSRRRLSSRIDQPTRRPTHVPRGGSQRLDALRPAGPGWRRSSSTPRAPQPGTALSRPSCAHDPCARPAGAVRSAARPGRYAASRLATVAARTLSQARTGPGRCPCHALRGGEGLEVQAGVEDPGPWSRTCPRCSRRGRARVPPAPSAARADRRSEPPSGCGVGARLMHRLSRRAREQAPGSPRRRGAGRLRRQTLRRP